MVHTGLDDTHLLVTFSTTKGQNFILKLSVTANIMKLIITDKATAEKWRCTYDSFYIENLTRKTGNFKQFHVFVSMLRAGLLKTNECVFIELLTQEELEMRRRKGPKVPGNPNIMHRKYLILVYRVEFDKIHYPLPLEYCGKPSPDVLQATVRKLENEVVTLRTELAQQRMKSKEEIFSREESLQNLIEQLNNENKTLHEEINGLKKLLDDRNSRNVSNRTAHKMEELLKEERSQFMEKIYRLEIENRKLSSLLSGRALCSRVPVKLNYDAGYNRSPSNRRSRVSRSSERNSCKVEPSGRGMNDRRRSPVRKLSSSSSSEISVASRKNLKGMNFENRRAFSATSDCLSSQERKTECKRNKKKKPRS